MPHTEQTMRCTACLVHTMRQCADLRGCVVLSGRILKPFCGDVVFSWCTRSCCAVCGFELTLTLSGGGGCMRRRADCALARMHARVTNEKQRSCPEHQRIRV